jgi:hypothetical protein
MLNNLIHFKNIPWEHPQNGAKQKVFSKDGKRLRLLRFSDSFTEEDWCTKGHVGFVVSGEMEIQFKDKIEHYQTGDGLWIEKGEDNKHKVKIKKGKLVELILFERK